MGRVRRPFCSDIAQAAFWALGYEFEEHFPTPQDLHWRLAPMWQAAVERWALPESNLFEPHRIRAMQCCPSSLVWSSGFRRSQAKPSKSRCCHQRWLCPFCYGREIVQFLRPFQHGTFDVTWSRTRTSDCVESLWDVEQYSRKLQARHGAVATWRTVCPDSDGYLTRAVWIHPGSNERLSFMPTRVRLANAFAYPLTLLTAHADLIYQYTQFTASHRGRSVSGAYRQRKKDPHATADRHHHPNSATKPTSG